MPKPLRTLSWLVLSVAPAAAALAAEPPAHPEPAASGSSDPFVLVDDETWRVKARVDALAAGFAYRGTWYGLAGRGPPGSGRFRERRAWAEFWLEPGVDVVYRISPGLEAYGGLSAGWSGTLGSDSFDQTDRNAMRFENAFAGIRTRNQAGDFNFDLSTGRQDYGVGTGMLVWQGAGNGFERGAGNTLPRSAWSNATIVRANRRGLKIEGFYLDPDELPANDTRTRLVGAVTEYGWGRGSRIGSAVLKVLNSEQVYPLPTLPLLIPKGRDDLRAVQLYARFDGGDFGLPGGWVRGEYAREDSDRIGMKADAIFGEVGYRFANLPFLPTFSYGYALFSGDDPRTRTYERFDPLFYGNGLDNWWFGANGAYAFLNANVRHHRLAVNLVLGPQDFFKAQYVRSDADRLDSPIQFGQGNRYGFESGGLTVATGVQKRHLADEIYGEWTHLINPKVATGLWASASAPGDGLKSITSNRPRTWFGAGVLVSARF